MALAFLMELLGRPLDVAEWIQRGDIHEKRLFAMAIPYAHMLYAKYLLLTGKPEIWLGMADEALGLAGALRYPLALIYGHIHSAAAWDLRKERALALSALRQALDLALPDRLYLPFAENIAFIGGLFPLLKDRSPPFKDIFALAEKQRSGQEAVSRALYAQSIPFGMTRREYEAAKLAAQGFSNFEIAEAMTVSTNTVKTFMKSIYQKTGALSRPALNKLFRQK
jgi:LuxR family maltose regulon positive regulatory protein